MARLQVRNGNLVARLNVVEKLAALHGNVAVPLGAVSEVTVIDRPWRSFLPEHVVMGFAARGAPGKSLVTVGPKATATDGGQALVVVYFNGRSVVVTFEDNPTPWRLFVVSSRHADDIARTLRTGATPTW